MKIVEVPVAEIGRIKELWEGLNAHHGARSTHFKDHFRRLTFEERIARLPAAENLVVYAATDDGGKAVGYCIGSCSPEDRKGEIDSIYIDPAYQGQRVGAELMEKTLAWLNGRGCEKISVLIAEGNEEAVGFYERCGFRSRYLVMEKTDLQC